MKVRNIYLLLLLALLLAGCRSHEIDESMSDAEKLELLNLKIDHHPNDASLLAYRAKVLLNLGRANEANSPTSTYYEGRMMEARLWYAAMDGTLIGSTYGGHRLTGYESNLVDYYPMNEGSATTSPTTRREPTHG